MKVGMTLSVMTSIEISEAMLDAAIACGMDSVWVPDHFLGIAHPDLWHEFPAATVVTDPDAWLDPFCVAAALGRRTTLPFGTCVTDGTRRRGVDLMRATLTLHQSCKGGFTLGIGAGEAESMLPFGYNYAQPIARLEETLRDMRSLLDTGHMPDGGVGRTGLARHNALGKPQIWVAASGPRALKLCGRYGDGWIQGPIGPDLYAEQLAQVRSTANEAGRKIPTACLYPLVLFGESREQVAATLDDNPVLKLFMILAPATLWWRYGLEHPAGRDSRGFIDVIPHLLDPAELRRIAPRIPIEMIEEFIMLGNAEDVTERLRPFIAAGANYVVLSDLTGLAYAPEKSVGFIQCMGTLKELLAP